MSFEEEYYDIVPAYVSQFHQIDLRGVCIERTRSGHRQITIKDENVKHVKAFGKHLNHRYFGTNLVVVIVNLGGTVLFSDVAPQMPDVGIMPVSMTRGPDGQFCDSCFDREAVRRHQVLLVDGFYRTGRTLRQAYDMIAAVHREEGIPNGIAIAALCEADIDRLPQNRLPVESAYLVDDGQIYGYGLDYNRMYRTERFLTWAPVAELAE